MGKINIDMEDSLKYLALTAFFCLIQWFPYILAKVMVQGLTASLKYKDIDHLKDPSGEGKPSLVLPGWASRAVNAHRNTVENLPSFAALVLVANQVVVNQDDKDMVNTSSAIFFFCRVAHCIVFISGVPGIRSIIFAAGWVSCLMIFCVICKEM